MSKKFFAYGKVTGTKFLGTFRAKNKKEAEQKALESDKIYVSLCHQCERQISDPEIMDVILEEVDENTEHDDEQD